MATYDIREDTLFMPPPTEFADSCRTVLSAREVVGEIYRSDDLRLVESHIFMTNNSPRRLLACSCSLRIVMKELAYNAWLQKPNHSTRIGRYAEADKIRVCRRHAEVVTELYQRPVLFGPER